MRLGDVIGQDETKRRLLQMISEGRIPHALMLCGASGYGTLPLALAFASRLLGGEEGSNPNATTMLAKFQHPDLHFVFPVIRPENAPSDRKITSDDFARQWVAQLQGSPYFSLEEWLDCMDAGNKQAQIFAAEGDLLAHKMSLKSSQGGYKVCIIWLPERMHPVFANKMLKLLEEPPQQTVFIMACEEPQMLFETIRSRVQRIDVKRISDEAIAEALQSRRGLAADMAQRVARMAAGNWLRAMEYLEASGERRELHDMFVLLMRMAYQRNTKGMKKWAESVAAFGREKQKRMLGYFAEQVRENFAYNFGRRELVYLAPEEEAFSRNFARFVNEANVVEMLGLIDHAARAIGQNANAKIEFFDFGLQTIVLINKS